MSPIHGRGSQPYLWPVRDNETDNIGSQVEKGSSIKAATAVVAACLIAIFLLVVGLSLCRQFCHSQEQPAESCSAQLNVPGLTILDKRAARREQFRNSVKSELFSNWAAKTTAKQRISKEDAAVPMICAICLNVFQDESILRVISCCHLFHVTCLDEWYARGHNDCPLYKGELCHLAPERPQPVH